ncbi:MAG: hypothetical protein JG770_1902, partial [Mahella sp.]|nr:hypothetical protein [Mahella sp.]
TPVPIPNTEVKPFSADGTKRETAWESRPLPGLFTICMLNVRLVNMYREIVKSEPMKFKKTALSILLTILFIIVFTALCNVIYNIYHFEFINYMVYIAMVCIAWEVFRRRAVEYKYSLIGDDLIFEKVVGGYRTVSLNVKLSEMLYLRTSDVKPQTTVKPDAVYKFAHVSCKNKIYCAIFDHDGQIYKVLFQPDQTMVELLEAQKLH